MLKHAIRLIAFACLLWLSCGCLATMYASVPEPNGVTPSYFSGTKARIGGWVKTDAGYITDAWLYLGEGANETVVSQFHYTGGPEVAPEVSFKIMFDSSHFADQTILKVRVKGIDSTTATIETSIYVVVKNRVVAWNYPPFASESGGNGAATVGEKMAGKNYDLLISTADWVPNDFDYELGGATIWYINSHGNPQNHYGYNDNHYVWGQMQTNHTNSYECYREQWNGIGDPPINSSQYPPIAFAELDFCNSGTLASGEYHFQTLLYPYWDAYGGLLKDQAVHGWPEKTFIIESQNIAWWIMGQMSTGLTLGVSRLNMISLNSETNHPVHLGEMTNLVDSTTETTVIGDVHTRIKGVYTGHSFVASALWYRPI